MVSYGLEGYSKERTLVMYGDGDNLQMMRDHLNDVMKGKASVWYTGYYNIAIWWGFLALSAFRMFKAAKALIRKWFDW